MDPMTWIQACCSGTSAASFPLGRSAIVGVVVQLIFPSLPAKRRYYWVVVNEDEVDLCSDRSGIRGRRPLDADLRTLTQVWMGDANFGDALADGRITLTGPREMTR